MRSKSVLSLLSVWLLLCCTNSQTQLQMQWTPYVKGGNSLNVLIAQGQQSYEVLLAARVDNRIDSLWVPAVISAYDYKKHIVLLDTIRFDLDKGSRSNVMQQEVIARLKKPFVPRATGIYKFSLRALYDESLEGLVSWGIVLSPVPPTHSADIKQ